MKQTFRRFLYSVGIVAMAFCLALGLVGCDEKNNQGEETPTEEILSLEASDDNEGVLSPKSAVEIYLAQKDLWMERPEYEPMIGYGYCLLDFDFDGVLELVNSVTDGSARITTNKFYRINQETLRVEEFSSAQTSEGESGVDYYYMAKDAKLYKNNSDGKMFYQWTGHIRVSMDEGVLTKTEVCMESGKVVESAISSEYWYPDYDNNMEEIREYTFKGKDVSKAEFTKAFEDYNQENKDLNLTFGYVEGASFDKGTSAEQKRLLTEAYQTFSYDGFSFDQIKTRDVQSGGKETETFSAGEVGLTDPKSYSMMDYRGMTIGDVAKIWGEDYTLANGMIGGGWAYIEYADRRCPFLFCFQAYSVPSHCTGSEKLAGVVVYAPGRSDFEYVVTENVKLTDSFAEITSKLNGEAYEDLLNGGQGYLYKNSHGDSVNFSWQYDLNLASEISVSFSE